MPNCNGTEIAKVIRQQDHFHSVPIIYLSAEDDVSKQLHAMSMGGDDFLTKPIDPKHFVATPPQQGRRARSLLALTIRDSLTGLYTTRTRSTFWIRRLTGPNRTGAPDLCHAGPGLLQEDQRHLRPPHRRPGPAQPVPVPQAAAAQSDHVGRYGGEEFAVILSDTTLEGPRQR